MQEKNLYKSDFGAAISLMKAGRKVRRAGWNGKGMYVKLVPAKDFEFSELLPFFVIKNVLNSFNTWVPSISDILANDWEIVEEVPAHEHNRDGGGQVGDTRGNG